MALWNSTQACGLHDYALFIWITFHSNKGKLHLSSYNLIDGKLQGWTLGSPFVSKLATTFQSVSTIALCQHHSNAKSIPSLQARSSTSSGLAYIQKKWLVDGCTLSLFVSDDYTNSHLLGCRVICATNFSLEPTFRWPFPCPLLVHSFHGCHLWGSLQHIACHIKVKPWVIMLNIT